MPNRQACEIAHTHSAAHKLVHQRIHVGASMRRVQRMSTLNIGFNLSPNRDGGDHKNPSGEEGYSGDGFGDEGGQEPPAPSEDHEQ